MSPPERVYDIGLILAVGSPGNTRNKNNATRSTKQHVDTILVILGAIGLSSILLAIYIVAEVSPPNRANTAGPGHAGEEEATPEDEPIGVGDE